MSASIMSRMKSRPASTPAAALAITDPRSVRHSYVANRTAPAKPGAGADIPRPPAPRRAARNRRLQRRWDDIEDDDLEPLSEKVRAHRLPHRPRPDEPALHALLRSNG